MRFLRVLTGMVVLVAVLALVLTSCPSNRDGMPGQLATAKEETQSAARSAALALQLWAQHRSTRDLTCVQLADARDEIGQGLPAVSPPSRPRILSTSGARPCWPTR